MKEPASSASPAALSILIEADSQPSAMIGGESQLMSGDDDDTFIDGVGLRKLFNGVSHMWPKRQMARDPSFPKPRYIGITPYWSLRALRAWWSSLPTKPPTSSIAAGVMGLEVLKEVRRKKKAEAAPPAKPATRQKPRPAKPRVAAE
jgi:hypothetical protein